MTGAVESILGNHGARLDSNERDIATIAARLDHLLFLMIGTLLTSVGALVAILVKH
jgi:hypothetical protein